MAKNTNRDYLVVIDVKRSNIISQDELIFYINDNESHNIFINLVVEDTKEPMAKYVPVDDIGKYKLVINIVKPTNEYEILEAELISAEDALYQIKLPDTCMNYIGSYKCEVETHYNNRITNSNKFKYKVKKSVLNDLDNIVEAPEYPLVIQLFDKLSDINQYEEERRQNEVARIAAEIARANTFNALQNDMQDSIQAIDSKALDMENRTATMENKVNTLVTDTKADLDTYKTTKDTQINQSISSMESTIDAYKNEKDQQINAAIQAQDTAIAEAKAAQDTAIEEAITTQNNTINTAISNQNTTINNAITTQNNRITTIESNNTVQNERLETLETTDVAHGTRLDNIEAVNITQNNRLTTVEAKNVEQDNRLDAIEIKNQQQDNRLLAIEKHDEKQDIDIKCLFSTVDTIDVTKEGNDITLQNSKLGFAVIDEIDGNTMVNCNKEADKSLVLNGNINTNGYSNVTLTDGVDGGLVDVALEGNTMVNVCDQKGPVAITKSYTVETGNHVALQGEYDGKCRPVITGNTLVNLAKFKRLSSGGNISVSNNIVTFDNSTTSGSCDFTLNAMKSNTTYTVIFNVLTMFDTGELRLDLFPDTYQELQEQSTIGLKILTFTTPEDISTLECFRFYVNGARTGICKVTYPIILEGDYTNKPIPGYFEGMQSSFEDKVVTQDMVDSGKELAENLGKYKVDYKVTGKNKIPYVEQGDINVHDGNNIPSNTISRTGYIPLKAGKTYKFTDLGVTNSDWYAVCLYDKNKNFIKVDYATTYSPTNDMYIRIKKHNPNQEAWTPQVEEGDTATPYEPYKEQVKTYYLNSPLLEGDTIEENGGNVVHVHRYKEIVLDGSDDEYWNAKDSQNIDGSYLYQIHSTASGSFGIGTTNNNMRECICDQLYTASANENWNANINYNNSVSLNMSNTLSIRTTLSTIDQFKAWLRSNAITVVARQISPQYEVISQNDTILCDSYVNGHLDVDSAVPIEKVRFATFGKDLKYLYPNTAYNIQLEADNVGKIYNLFCGGQGTTLQNLNVVKGINKYSITTLDNPNPYIDISGIGFSASNIVVTEATEQDFGYFEGMKSVGECEGNIEILSKNKNLLDLKNPINLGFIPAKMEGDKIVFNSSGVQGERLSIAFPVYLRKGSTYRFSYSNIEGNPDILGTTVQIHPNLSSVGQSGVSTKSPFTWDKDSGIYYARVYNMFVEGTVKVNIQLEENDIATSYVEPQSNTQQLTHEPLRAVGDVKDRYVLIDGKWYIERNCAEIVLDGSENWSFDNSVDTWDVTYLTNISNYFKNTICVCNKYMSKSPIKAVNQCSMGNNWGFQITHSKNTFKDVYSFKSHLQQNPITVVYKLASPTYEPIDYSPFTVYSDVTHISNNSTIPANMVIKNTGYNCMLKPSTTYTVSSNQGVNVVTTPSTLTEDCLRFYDSDTSSVTTMKNFMLLEGDYTTNGKPMPSHFSGIESAFEQEYDEAVGKYKVKAKVVGKNLVSSQQLQNYYYNSPWGNGNINTFKQKDSKAYMTTKIRVKPNTIYTLSAINSNRVQVHFFQKYTDELPYNGINNTAIFTTDSNCNYVELYLGYEPVSTIYNIQLEQGNTATPYEPYKEHSIEFYINEPLRGIGDVKDKVYSDGDNIVIQRNCGSITLDGSGDEMYTEDNVNLSGRNNYSAYYSNENIGTGGSYRDSNKLLCDKMPIYAYDYATGSFGDETGVGSVSGRILISVQKAKLATIDLDGFRNYLNTSPMTFIYQLASPTYEVIEYPDTKLLLDIFPNSTLYFENNVPVTSTVRYTYSVPLNDAVATVSDISDQQDSMIIDMATQVAVMEMMLM